MLYQLSYPPLEAKTVSAIPGSHKQTHGSRKQSLKPESTLRIAPVLIYFPGLFAGAPAGFGSQ